MKKLSLVMITKNEESNLRRCLDSVKNIVDEIVIVDTGSTDKTKDIALEFSAKVYDYEWDNNFSNARNYALSKSTGDWNLILDADEFVTNINLDKIHNFINSNNKVIGRVKRIDLFKQDGEIRKSSAFISRLAPKDVYFTGSIHEQLDCDYSREIVDIELDHDGYLYTNKFDRNIILILEELKADTNNSYLLYQAAKTYYCNQMHKEASPYFDEFYENFNYNTDAFAKDGLVLYLYNIIKTSELEKGLKVIEDYFDIMSEYCDFYFVCGVYFTELVSANPEKYMCYFESIELCYLNALQLGESNDSDSVEGTGSYLAEFNLGVFYELTGNIEKSIQFYRLSYDHGYSNALNRLNTLQS